MNNNIIKVGFVGAGGVNFGSPEGPWDHASRLEKIGNVDIVAIADPDTKKAGEVLQKRQSTQYAHLYKNTNIRASFVDMIELDRPDVVFIGLPPHCHGLSEPPFNVECVCADAGVHMFVEKPISSYKPEMLLETVKKVKEASSKGVITSVGYMFRYHKCLDKMKEIIRYEATHRGLNDNEHHITTVLAKFNCAYSLISKNSWWDVRASGGPVVEQCTHLVDLIRYITESECNTSSITAYSVHADHPVLGTLTGISKIDNDGTDTVDASIPIEHRAARATTSVWMQESGTLCQLSHGVQLQGSKYEAELEVWADGIRMTLQDPYGDCKLIVRGRHCGEGHGDSVKVYEFEAPEVDVTADPYYNEVECFLHAVRTGDQSAIRSSYEDAFKTYQLTWDIQNSVIKNRNV